nr:hypothetical protein GCM10020092_058760 [Actinoplanes digitatis]
MDRPPGPRVWCRKRGSTYSPSTAASARGSALASAAETCTLTIGSPAPSQVAQRVPRLLPGAGEVRQVEADAEPGGVHAGEQARGLRRRLDDAAGLGLEPDPDLPVEQGQRAGQLVEVVAAGVGACGVPRFAPGERQGGDGPAGGGGRQQVVQHPGQVEGVREPLRGGPVRLVDGVLDHRRLERLVREPVEHDDLEPARVEFPAQPLAAGDVGGEPGRHRCREPQAETEHVGAEPVADRHRVGVQLRQDAGEVLGGVHVGAVRQVHGLPAGVPQPHQPPPRAMELPAKVATGAGLVRSRRPDWL